MNLETRKIEFIKEFLKVQSEDVISRLEEIIRKEKLMLDEENIEPMTEEELNERIDQSESDFSNNRFKTNSELLSKFE